MSLYIAFVDLAKAFYSISRVRLYRVLGKIGCPPTLLKIVQSFHEGMEAYMFPSMVVILRTSVSDVE